LIAKYSDVTAIRLIDILIGGLACFVTLLKLLCGLMDHNGQHEWSILISLFELMRASILYLHRGTFLIYQVFRFEAWWPK